MKLSLRARLLWVSLTLLLLFLSLTAWVLDQAFVRSIENNARSQLQLHIYALLTAAEEIDGQLFLPEVLQEPRFNQLSTGLYGWVVDKKGNGLWQSASAIGDALTQVSDLLPGEKQFEKVNQTGAERYQLSFAVLWEGVGSQETFYTFIVAEDAALYESQVSGFRRSLWGWLSAMAIVLLIVQFAITTWGLFPLKTLAFNLRRIEKGDSDQVEGEYPKELNGVVTNLNLLIEHEHRQRERYKNSLGDLAHSLKTPLAVVKGSLNLTHDQEELKRVINEQTERMDSIVAYQLKRAMAASPANLSQKVFVAPLVERISGALEKVYRDKGVTFINELSEELLLAGDESDFYEVLGNLLDNAFKHCLGLVRIGFNTTVPDEGNTEQVTISIEDDGKGIPKEHREEVVNRGVRADTSLPGQGIGLSVVREIVESYGGNISVHSSRLGGARIDICLPKVFATVS
ncbi:MAG: ATP-binding protein [Pseudomonadales bacterium]|nr:ATP-binding protein [Pseudomonadales bacterium]